jgi:Phage tail tube protein
VPNPTIYPSNLTWLGIAKETTYGTPVATPTYWIPLMDPAWKPDQKILLNEAIYGDMSKVHGAVQGTRFDTLAYKTYLFLDTIFPHMETILGAADTVTGASDPYTHKTSLQNTGNAQPPSWTLSLYNGAETWQMAGSVMSKVDVDLKAQDLSSMSGEWMGLPAVKVSNPTNTPSTAKPWASWNTTINVNSIQATNYSDIKLTFTRECEAVQTADGTVAPYVIFVGPLNVEGDLTGVYQGYTNNPADLSNFLTNTEVPVTVQVNPVGDPTHYGLWQQTLCAFTSVEVKAPIGKYLEVNGKFVAIANTTDATSGGQSPTQFKMLTAVSTAY